MRSNPALKASLAIGIGLFLMPRGTTAAEGGGRLLLDNDPPVISAPGFRLPLDAAWSVARGSWTPKDGVLDAVELPAEKHAAVLHHNVGLESAAIECDFRMEAQSTFLIGCDGAKHVGRAIVRSGGLDIAEDSVKPSHILASLKKAVSPGVWHHLRVEWRADEIAASLDGREIRARHPYLATPKVRSWLAVGKSAKVRELKIRGVKTAGQ